MLEGARWWGMSGFLGECVADQIAEQVADGYVFPPRLVVEPSGPVARKQEAHFHDGFDLAVVVGVGLGFGGHEGGRHLRISRTTDFEGQGVT